MGDSSVVITAFSMDHYQSVFQLWSRSEGMGLGDADSATGIARYLERNPGMSFVALDGPDVVGALLAGHDGRRGYLHHLAVDPAYRHRGLAGRLVDCALDALRREGITKCHGFVFRNNVEGLRFWERLAWEPREDIVLVSTNIDFHH